VLFPSYEGESQSVVYPLSICCTTKGQLFSHFFAKIQILISIYRDRSQLISGMPAIRLADYLNISRSIQIYCDISQYIEILIINELKKEYI